jgi:diguanylate cyclase (GGDEF)-like protein
MLMLDIDMPEVSGIELCRVVRNDRRWAALPVLFLTSRRDEATVREVFASGADDYLQKPVIREELVGRVRSRLERARLHRLLAERDALTGVSNRQSSVRGIERLLALSRRYGEPVTLAAVDLDHFKHVNDKYGHAAGDAVLRRLGELLLRSFRGEDVVGRWGGEEFVVGMYGMAPADAERRMCELLSGFAAERFTTADGVEFSGTFSAGVATFRADGEDLPELHRAADAALYAAKDAGRNCVRVVGRALSA